MDYEEELTQQATQNVIDPRRVGKQNSGFSDEDVSDIICLLYPQSEGARKEAQRIALESSAHIVGRQDADNVNVDLSGEDDASRFQLPHAGDYAIILRLSAVVRNPAHGFTFGRNTTRCDIVFRHDPHRRLSNIHFRIYVNEYGVVMIEDQSTNGTVVDNQLLKGGGKNRGRAGPNDVKRVLTSGSIISILMHEEGCDLTFLVRIPRRDGDYEAAYRQKLIAYLGRLNNGTQQNHEETIVPGEAGRLDIFTPHQPPTRQPVDQRARPERLPRDWDGSGKYNVSGTIGKGAFATVHMATSKFDGCPYAAKELEKRRFMKNGILDQKVENEMKIMQSVQHRNIVQYIEHFDWKDRLIIIMEYVRFGDLGHYIMENGPLSEDIVRRTSVQLLGALEHLHQKNITHRDIKPDNILISNTIPFEVKLTDFGLSKMVDNDQTFLQTFCGTLLYCAPEVYGEFVEYDENGNRDPNRRRYRENTVGQRYDHAVDIWSLGGVLFYCLTGSAPYPVKSGITYMELLHKVMTTPLDVTPLLHRSISLECVDCLKGMINKNPSSRATIVELQQHRWHGGDVTFENIELVQSDDEISDDQLEQSASQLRIQEVEDDLIPESDDEGRPDSEIVPDFADLGAERENHTFGPRYRQPRLFGEVGVSALQSSGAIPRHRLNLPIPDPNETEILGNGAVIPDSDSDDFPTPRQKSQPKSQPCSQPLIFSMSQSQDVLDELEPGSESQSLGCAESILGNLNMKSVVHNTSVLTSIDLASSKRKPELDRSDEDLDRYQGDKPSIKRLKSDGQIDTLIEDSVEELGLLACLPPAVTGRRKIDAPVHKSTFWNNSDRRTWHLIYPEMTVCQYNAFRAATQQRGEEFAPGKTPLWELAMKYFPPTTSSTEQPDERDDSSDTKSTGKSPSAASPNDVTTHGGITQLPFTPDIPPTQAIATLESTADSVVTNILIPISSCFTSFGRDKSNSIVYEYVRETRISKHALKVLLWRPGFDSLKQLPWLNTPSPDENKSPESLSYAFYIATKATNGLTINKTSLPSHECKNPSGSSKYWIKLHDGDIITLWGTEDQAQHNNIRFRCSWGGSSLPRAANEPASLVSPEIAQKLDESCYRAERMMRRQREYNKAMDEANKEVNERRNNFHREGERSRAFELKRKEAVRIIAAKSQRMASPTFTSDTLRVVPQLRHMSPTVARAEGERK